MTKKKLIGGLSEFLTTFSLTLLVSAAVTFLYNLAEHGTGSIDWETSVRLAIILGIVLTWFRNKEGKGI
jgi:hypothetical protein